MNKTALILAASIAAAFVSTATSAFASVQAPAVRHVAYADLDLGSAAGRDRLNQRIDAAVRDVCGSAYPTDLRATSDVATCRAATRAAIVYPAALRGTATFIAANGR